MKRSGMPTAGINLGKQRYYTVLTDSKDQKKDYFGKLHFVLQEFQGFYSQKSHFIIRITDDNMNILSRIKKN